MSTRQSQLASSTRLRIGRNGLMYLAVTAVIGGVAAYSGSNLLYAGLGLTLGGLIVSLGLSLVSMRRLRLERIVPDHGVVDEPLMLRYQLHNEGVMPLFGVIIYETWGRGRGGWRKTGPIAESPPRLAGRPFGWLMHIGPRQTLQAETLCWPRRRGRLAFDTVCLETAFPFGLIRKTVRLHLPSEVLVYPALYRINRRLLHELSMMDPAGHRQVERAGGNEEFFGLREYRAGESLRYIDWKHSARKGKLIAREMTQPTPPRLMVLLVLDGVDEALAADAQRHVGEPELEGQFRGPSSKPPPKNRQAADASEMMHSAHDLKERAIALTASLVCDAYQQGFQLGLTVQGPNVVPFNPRHSVTQRHRLLSMLSQLDADHSGHHPAGLSSEPSVMICAHGGAAPMVRHHCTMLDARHLTDYVTAADGQRLMQRDGPDEVETERRDYPATVKTGAA